MPGSPQPLDQQFAIVDAQGRPTGYFIRWAQERQNDIQDSGVWGKITGTLDDQEDLKTTLDTKLSIEDDPNWPAAYKPVRMSLNQIFTTGDNAVTGTITFSNYLGGGGPGNGTGFLEFDSQNGATGGGFVGGAFSHGTRILFGTYAPVTGYEFDQMPYVGPDRMLAMTGNTFINALNDAAAAAAGIPVGGLYRNGSVVMVRVV